MKVMVNTGLMGNNMFVKVEDVEYGEKLFIKIDSIKFVGYTECKGYYVETVTTRWRISEETFNKLIGLL